MSLQIKTCSVLRSTELATCTAHLDKHQMGSRPFTACITSYALRAK